MRMTKRERRGQGNWGHVQGRKHTRGLWNVMKEGEDSEQTIGLLEALLGPRTFTLRYQLIWSSKVSYNRITLRFLNSFFVSWFVAVKTSCFGSYCAILVTAMWPLISFQSTTSYPVFISPWASKWNSFPPSVNVTFFSTSSNCKNNQRNKH